MTQDIKFQGLSNSPSDYDAQDGELGALLNLINEDGALKPIHQPIVTDSNITIPDGATVELVHKVTHENTIHSHYIIRRADDTWCWTEKDGDGTFTDIDLDGFHANAVTAVGNILNFVGDTNIMYAYWKLNLYNVIDVSNIQFSANINIESGPAAYDNYAGLDNNIVNVQKHDEYYQATNTLTSKYANDFFKANDAFINSYLDDESFKYIQFGILALRMYDGTYMQISNPFVVTRGLSSNKDIYVVKFGSDTTVTTTNNEYIFKANKDYALHLRSMLYKALMNVSVENIDLYDDIIDGVDVFISNSIYPYKTNVELVEEQYKCYINSLGNFISLTLENEDTILFFSKYDLSLTSYLCHWQFPAMSQDELNEEIKNLVFYKSTSFSIDEIKNNKSKYLKRILQTEQTISLANNMQTQFGGKVAITYNNRLHVANVSTQYTLQNSGLVQEMAADKSSSMIIKTTFKNNGQTMCSYSIFSDNVGGSQYIYSFYHTDVISYDVYYAYLRDGYSYFHKSLSMSSFDDFGMSLYLNYSNGIINEIPLGDSITEDEWNAILEEAKSYVGSPIVSHSLIKVSEAENPLVFPAKNSVQVGSSIINALAANTRPISEGQFGEAPLYAFTDEGVWTLMTSSEGTYEARQPANREICTNPKSILQIDDAVLFATERGIMLQNGKNAECITDVLDGYPFDFTQLYKADYAKKVLAVGNISEEAVKYVRFRDYLQEADMIYDYYDNRIIVFNAAYPYAYVYSLKSKTWSTMANTINKRVNIYPESYGVNKDGKLVDVYVKEPTDSVPYFLCSRPLGLGTPEVFKTMFTAITRGYFRGTEAGKCGMVLYGSNDLFHWYLIKSSVDKYLRGMMGSPYKYFRIALIGSLLPDESISGMSADFTERWQNKLR